MEQNELAIGDLCRVISTKPRDYRGTYEGIIVEITHLPQKNDVRYCASRDGWGALLFYRENLELTDLKQDEMKGYNDGKAYGLRYDVEIDGVIENALSRMSNCVLTAQTPVDKFYSIGYEKGFKDGLRVRQ